MWYVVQTISGKEYSAIDKCRNALNQNIATRIFTPTSIFMRKHNGQRSPEKEITFPGYVFIESERPKELEDALKNISGVVTPVRIGGGFYPIRSEEEAFLREMMDEDNCIRFSVGYLVDGKLQIQQGPLKENTERVKRINRHNQIAELHVQFFEEPKKMFIGLEVKAKLTAEEYERLMETA